MANSDAVELTEVKTVISKMSSTRADNGSGTPQQKGTEGYIGREFFIGGDKMTLTKFCRTEVSMDSYSYNNLGFESNSDGAWNRTSSDPDRIYWTDNSNDHTFIGFSCPQVWYNGEGLIDGKWDTGNEGDHVNYFGHFSYDENKVVDFSDNDKISGEDILLSYDTEKQADPGGSVATLHYKHALASARIVVNIMNFAPDDKSEDVKTKVSDLKIEEQPWKYKWAQMPVDNVNGINHPGWGVQRLAPLENEPANVTLKTWLYDEEGTGVNRNKTFTFRSLIVPGRQEQVKISFKVEYPDALNTANKIEKTYRATLSGGVFFEPGKTTIIRISLNHRNESITIGAEYIDWENEETPNQTSLAKYSTFLAPINPPKREVTIVGDEKATIEDATWLYENNEEKIVDIYNNDGTEEKPFTIKTALQFLSFAYEVKNGRSFENQYVKLDASLVLQPETEPGDATSTSWATTNWIGVGDETHAFNGTFIGTTRYVRYLKGTPLFANIGSKGKVCGLTLENVVGVTSGGMIAATNAGTICACIANINTINNFSAYSGLCGTNSGNIVACGSMGPVNATEANAGICGTNTGNVVACYSGIKSKAGIVASGNVTDCYYDSDKSSGTASDGSTGMTTERMQLQSFVTTLNNAIDTWCGTNETKAHLKSHRFGYRAAYYPNVK